LCVKSDRNGEKSMKSPIIKRSIMIASHRTSISLEEPFWRGLKDIAARHETSVQNVVASVHGGRHRGNLSSSLRQFVLEYYRSNCCDKAEGRKARIMGLHE
jgi:predicted DNA-binding ribbon-helix-helix protein